MLALLVEYIFFVQFLWSILMSQHSAFAGGLIIKKAEFTTLEGCPHKKLQKPPKTLKMPKTTQTNKKVAKLPKKLKRLPNQQPKLEKIL